MLKLKKRGLFLFILYALIVVLLNMLPLSLAEKIDETVLGEFRLDYFTHALIFLPWSSFRCLFFKRKKVVWFTVGFLFAIAMEGSQYFLTYRSFNWYDMLFNVLGLALGYLVFSGLNMKIEEHFLCRNKEEEVVEMEEEL